MGKDTIYEMVTDKVVAMLAEGTVPWRKPWNAGTAPRNIEGHVYRGINVMLLSMSEYSSPFWLTFKQAKERGGSVKKGEKSTMVVFWKRLLITDKETGERSVVPMLRYFNVFNLDQTEGVKLPKAVAEYDAEALVQPDPIAAAEAIVAGYADGPEIRFKDADRAFYVPATDVITVPPLSSYDAPEEYYSTLFHEMGHSTGNAKRLNRKYGQTFGSHDYGREELVAEMTAAFLCAESGIETTLENSAAYLNSWIRTIREDPRAVVVAAGAAQRAADLVLGRKFEDREPEAQQEKAPAA